VAKDICDVLGLGHTRNSIQSLSDVEKIVVTRSTNRNLFTLGRGASWLALISESGLYKLAMPFGAWGQMSFEVA
jgi:prophage antirepressor-like protein